MTAATPTNATLAERAAHVLMPNYGARDVAMISGQGPRCTDADGNEYLDFLGGIAVNALGHAHPAVVKAAREQAERLIHCSNVFLIEPQIELAEKLCRASAMDKALFVNSGAEATEAAMKLARHRAVSTGREDATTIMVFEGSFHGRTWGAMSATHSAKVRNGFGPLVPGYRFARFNDLESVDENWDDTVCAVLVETVQGEGGIVPADGDFLQGLRERCTARNAALITDEIQCGIARSGRPFAFQHAGIEPDIVPFAKGVAGGFPLGGVLARGDYADVLQRGSHGSTFGGNPVACAAGCAVCDIVFDEEFLREVGRKGCDFWGGLEELKREFPDHIDHMRGTGLMLGMVLKQPGADMVGIARKHGLLINCTADKVLRFLPPLIITDADIAEAVQKLRAAFQEWTTSAAS